MAMPVAAIIVLLAVFNGLESRVRALYRAIDADIEITPAEGTTFAIGDIDWAAIDAIEGIASRSTVLEQGAMVSHQNHKSIVRLKGVDENYNHTIPLANQMLSGEFFTQRDDKDFVVASMGIMHSMGLGQGSIGEKMSLYAINRSRFSTLLPVGGYKRQDATVVGLVALDEANNSLMITSLRAAQRLFNYPDRASAIELRVVDEKRMDEVAQRLKETVGSDMKVLTRYESNSLYRLMALEKWGVFAVAALVMIIASLSIVGTLIMVIIDKRDDISTLRTMGMQPAQVRQIFTAEGYMMTALSLVIGLVTGLGLTLAQQHLGLVRLDATSIGIDAYPVELQWGDVVATILTYCTVAVVIVRLTVGAMLKPQHKENKE